MAKLYVFTLDFTMTQAHQMHTRAAGVALPNFFSTKDAFGYFQYFHSNAKNYFVPDCAPDSTPEPLDIHFFKRAFTLRSQVNRAVKDGCMDIRRFYALVNELKSKEKIYTVCRVKIHGGVGNHIGFEMEELLLDRFSARSPVDLDSIGKMIINSLPPEGRAEFTPELPMNIHLIACSAGASKHYFSLESASLASSVTRSLLDANIYSRVQASTTSIVSPQDYFYLESITTPRIFKQFDFETILDLFNGDYYYRRGVMSAIDYLLYHAFFKDDREKIEKLEADFITKYKSVVCVDMPNILRSRKVGYRVVYVTHPDRSISIYDYMSKKQFISKDDVMLESHRDMLLQHFWLGYFYDLLAQSDAQYVKYRMPIPNSEILHFIDSIESANNRAEITMICKRSEEQQQILANLCF